MSSSMQTGLILIGLALGVFLQVWLVCMAVQAKIKRHKQEARMNLMSDNFLRLSNNFDKLLDKLSK